LPGVGRYTANAVATFAFHQPVPIVETNTARLLARLFDMRAPLDSAIGREKLWNNAARLVPRRHAARFNSALVDLGALVCLPDKPKCNVCPVEKFCRAKNPEALPIKKSKDTHWSLATARFCSNNHPHAGVGCGFCRGSKQNRQLISRFTRRFFHLRITK
jgi:adenine-specific DNA glycosylase